MAQKYTPTPPNLQHFQEFVEYLMNQSKPLGDVTFGHVATIMQNMQDMVNDYQNLYEHVQQLNLAIDIPAEAPEEG